jgi:hypothetical protein
MRAQKRSYSHSRVGGAGEAGPIAAADVGGQGELADHQGLAADVDDRAVHLAGVVLEDAQVDDLARQEVYLAFAIAVLHAQQHEKPGPDRRDSLSIDRDARFADPLYHSFHGRSLAASPILLVADIGTDGQVKRRFDDR